MSSVPSATIHLSRFADGWRWRIADAEGRALGSGAAPGQMEAMADAWRLADPRGADLRRYPEFVIEVLDQAA
jgi:hypothetical protein